MKTRRKIQLLFIILTIAFIWGHSVVPTEQSAQESDSITNGIIAPILRFFLGRFVTVDGNLVRKFAHAIEFFVLGVQVLLYVITDESFCVLRRCENVSEVKRDIWLTFALSLLLCMITAGIDETIQVFSGRGPSQKDVIIDSLGAVIGVITGQIAVFIYLKKARKNEIENQP